MNKIHHHSVDFQLVIKFYILIITNLGITL